MSEGGDKPQFLDRRAVARAFDRASGSYDAAAALQVDVRNELLDRLGHFATAPRVVLDAGAGTGHATRALKQRYPESLVLALDLAPGMLVQAGQRMGLRDRILGGRFGHRFERIAGDVYRLPLADASVQLVFSSLMLQWCDDLETALVEIRRVLAPGGLLLFSSFGPQTLQELRSAWSAADGAEHVNPFMDLHDVGTAMTRAGFTEPVVDVDRLVRHYADALELMREIKQIGARNALQGRPRGLTGRQRLAAMQSAYEAERDAQGRLPATWEVIYAAGFAAERNSRGGGSEVVVPLSRIGRR
jgi:malonyl-CoA O-methyltransferase